MTVIFFLDVQNHVIMVVITTEPDSKKSQNTGMAKNVLDPIPNGNLASKDVVDISFIVRMRGNVSMVIPDVIMTMIVEIKKMSVVVKNAVIQTGINGTRKVVVESIILIDLEQIVIVDMM